MSPGNQILAHFWIYSDDAARNEMGEGKSVFESDLGIKEPSITYFRHRPHSPGLGSFQQLRKGRDRGYGSVPGSVSEPWNPGLRVSQGIEK
jgi:hypothetical protein